MLNSGDVVDVDLGVPQGREAGFPRPALVITAQRVLEEGPSVAHIVPLTTTVRGFGSEIIVEPDLGNGLDHPSSAQCQHLRSVSTARIKGVRGNVGPIVLAEVRETLAVLLDLPH